MIPEPGPNYYLEDNVWVDAEDRLHLLITKHPKYNWTTSEVYSVRKGAFTRFLAFLVYSQQVN